MVPRYNIVDTRCRHLHLHGQPPLDRFDGITRRFTPSLYDTTDLFAQWVIRSNLRPPDRVSAKFAKPFRQT